MNWEHFLQQVLDFLQPNDTISILVTFFITQRVKIAVPERARPWTAIGVGMGVSLAWCLYTSGWNQLFLYGFIYGAGAIALYMLGLEKLIKKIPGGEKVMGE